MKKALLILTSTVCLFGAEPFSITNTLSGAPVKQSEPIVIVMQKPEGPFYNPAYFENMVVVETVTRKAMTIHQIMEILDKSPNVKTVSLFTDPPPNFSVDKLAYPQCEDQFKIPKERWLALQEKCRAYLTNPIAVDSVIKHWRSITNGIPPFGLKVAE